MRDATAWDAPGPPTAEIVAELAARVGDPAAADLAARIYEFLVPSFKGDDCHPDQAVESSRGEADEAEYRRRVEQYEVPGKPGVIRYANRRARMELIAEWAAALTKGQGGCSDALCREASPASTRPPSSPRKKRASKPAAGCPTAG